MIGLIFKFKLASILAFIFNEGIELRPLAVGQCCCKKIFLFLFYHIFLLVNLLIAYILAIDWLIFVITCK